MQTVGRVISSALTGSIAGGVIGFLNFFILMQSDGLRFDESVGYSLVAGTGCTLAGFFIGLTIGALDLGIILGGIIGLAAVFINIVFLALVLGSGGNQLSFFHANWRVMIIFTVVPFVLSGLITSVFKNLIFRLRLFK